MNIPKIVGFVAILAIGAAAGYFGRGFLGGGHDHDHATEQATSQPSDGIQYWTCSMDPQVKQPEFGLCPVCGMDLIPKTGAADLGPNKLAVTPEAAALAEIVTARVVRRPVAHDVRLVGKVDYDETRVRTISAWIPSGRIERQFVDYTGVPVREGEHLVLVYSPELLTAQQELLEAVKAVEASRSQPSEFLRASDMRRLESAREKLRLWGLTSEQVEGIEERGTPEDRVLITSPTSGIVIHKGLNEGDYVQTGTPIYRIADLDHLWVMLDAYESDLKWVRYGQKVELEADAFPGETIEGRITFIAPAVDEMTRTVKVRVNVDNRERRLKPGMFVRARVEAELAAGGRVLDGALAGKWICPMHPEVIDDSAGTCSVCGMDTVPAEQLGVVGGVPGASAPLIVPHTAVLITGTRGVVYVQHRGQEGPVYESREVVLGPRAGDYYIVKAGLEEDERVVVNGNFKIDSALQLEGKASMMALKPGPLEGPGMATFRSRLAPVYAAYFDAQEALAADDPEAADRALETFVSALAETSQHVPDRAEDAWGALASDLERDATKAREAGSVEDVRVAFKTLSSAMIEVESVFGHADSSTHVEIYCSMAFGSGAHWLQRSEPIRNPFYGAEMLECGSHERTFLGSGDGEGR